MKYSFIPDSEIDQSLQSWLYAFMANKKAKRYTDAKKKEILDFIEAQGRGGQTKAVKKYKVTAASIAAWKKKAGGISSPRRTTEGSKELQVVAELKSLLEEIAKTEAKLDDLRRAYKKTKAKI